MTGLHRWTLALLSATALAASQARADDPQKEKSFEKEITVKVKLDYLLAPAGGVRPGR